MLSSFPPGVHVDRGAPEFAPPVLPARPELAPPASRVGRAHQSMLDAEEANRERGRERGRLLSREQEIQRLLAGTDETADFSAVAALEAELRFITGRIAALGDATVLGDRIISLRMERDGLFFRAQRTARDLARQAAGARLATPPERLLAEIESLVGPGPSDEEAT